MQTKKAINATLKLLGLAGLSGVTIAAPSTLQAMDIFLRKNTKAKMPNCQRILKELKRQGLVHVSQYDNEVAFTLTPAGIHRLQQSLIDELEIPKPKKWDKKWRVVTFDIPTRQSKQRAYFTKHLKDLDFYMLQRSLWVHPFPCFDVVERIAGHYNVLRYCALLEIHNMDSFSTRKLIRHFESLLI